MKKNSLLLCLLLAGAMGATAQSDAHTQLPDYAVASPLPGTVAGADDSAFRRPEYINNINVSAIRDFMRRFKEPVNTRWFNIHGKGFIARFEQPGVTCRVSYTIRGQWVYTIRCYHEKQMPHNIRHLVKSTYYDYSITGIDEVEQYNLSNLVYVIYLEDDTSYTTLRVCDGEMDVMETLTKRVRQP